MKIKMMFRLIGVLISCFALIMFVLIGCSKEDSDDDSDAFTSGHVWEAGDYPSLIAPDFNNAPEIGEPILTFKALHTGNFNPMLKSYLGKNWHGSVFYDKSFKCGSDTAHWDETGEIWNYLLPSQRLTFDLYAICGDETETFNSNHFGWNLQRRFVLMHYGEWFEGEYGYNTKNGKRTFRTYFKQILGHPDLYITMERDWVYELGTDITKSGENSYEISIETKTGVVKTQITKIGETLEVGAEAVYQGVTASINKTFSSETTNETIFSKDTIKIISDIYKIPANETWRFVTLYGVERYFFTDNDGNNWNSENLVIDELGELENHIRTFVMIVKYKSNTVTPFANEMVELAN